MSKAVTRITVLFIWVLSVVALFAILKNANMFFWLKVAGMVIYIIGSLMFAIDIDSDEDEDQTK